MNRSEESKKVSELVLAWLAGEYTMFDAVTEEPEIAWQAILDISKRELSEEQLALLAAGPLETLLSLHGAVFIDRLLDEAKRSSRFNHLLGGVWRQKMPQEIWERIESVRKDAW